MIAFVVPGEPVQNKAPQFSRRGNHVQTRKADGIEEAQELIRQAAWLAVRNAGQKVLDGPVVVDLRIYRSKGRPRSKKGQRAAERGEIVPTTYPDWDNYSKLICDAMNKIVYRDDGQIVEAHVYKFFSARPRVEVRVREWHYI